MGRSPGDHLTDVLHAKIDHTRSIYDRKAFSFIVCIASTPTRFLLSGDMLGDIVLADPSVMAMPWLVARAVLMHEQE